MYIDCTAVKGENTSFSCGINIVSDTTTKITKLNNSDFSPFPLSGVDENGDYYGYSIIFRILGAPTADAKVLVEHVITADTDIDTDGQITDSANGQFTFVISKEDTEVLGLGKFPIQICLVDEDTLENVYTLTLGGERDEFSKVQIVQV